MTRACGGAEDAFQMRDPSAQPTLTTLRSDAVEVPNLELTVAPPEGPVITVKLEVVPLDPATCDHLPTPADVVTVQESFDDPTEWITAVEAKRAQIEGR